MKSAIIDSVILIGIIANYLYVRKLEKDIEALKEWIKFFYHLDLDKMSEAIRKHNKRGE